MATKYYVTKLLGESEPVCIYRFFDDNERSPEAFHQGKGWVPIPNLWASIASGKIDDDDLISESEATKVIEGWGGKL